MTSLYFVLPLICAFIFASCSTKVVDTNKNFTGEEIFKGLFFGEGKVADLIPEIKNQAKWSDYLTTEDILKVKAFQTEFIAQLKKQDPAFFSTFKTIMQSGNHMQIEKTLMATSQELVDAIFTKSHIDPHSVNKSQIIKELGSIVNRDDVQQTREQINKIRKESLLKLQSLQYVKLQGSTKLDKASADSDTRDPYTHGGDCIAVVAVVSVAVVALAVAVVFAFWVGASADSVQSELRKEQITHSIAINLQ